MSSYAQELCCYVGQQTVFEDASELLKLLKGIDINSKQIERICHIYGRKIEQIKEIQVEKQEVKQYPNSTKDTIHYAMMDGGMFLTRTDGWNEVKLGRVFSQDNNILINKDRGLITETEYIAHLGTHTHFIEKFQFYLKNLPNPVFICDGAKWIWNYIDDYYPNSVQILDYFHGCEHLYDFSKTYFHINKRKKWESEQIELINNDGIGKVIQNLENLEVLDDEKKAESKRLLIQYFKRNQKRMMYKTFKDKGLLIGSGAIESAIRCVLQQRMKLSGQRWTKEGFQEVANLRTIYKSKKGETITQLVKMAA